MFVIKRKPGESVDVIVGDYKYVVKLTKVVGGAHAWMSINGDLIGPLPVGHSVIIQDTYTTTLLVLRIKGKSVTFGFEAPKEVVLRATEKTLTEKGKT